MTFIQHNVGHSRVPMQAVLQQGFESNTDILLLQEPYTPKSPEGKYICITHPEYHTVPPRSESSPSSMAQRPRVLTYIRKKANIQFNPRYDLCEDPDMQIIKIIDPLEPFFIINIYNEHQRLPNGASSSTPDPSQPWLRTADRLLFPLQLTQPTLIAGDFNSHHPLWNADANPGRVSQAEPLVQWAARNRAALFISVDEINEKGGTLIRDNLLYQSVIDLAFTSRFSRFVWDDWRYSIATGSDHEVICFQASCQVPIPSTPHSLPSGFNIQKADWGKFEHELKQQVLEMTFQPDPSEGDLDVLAESLTSAVESAAAASMPRLRPCSRTKPWWSDDLKALRRLHHRALRRYKKSRIDSDMKVWKAARNSYFNAVQTAKTRFWERFLDEASGTDIFTAVKFTKPAAFSYIPSIEWHKDGMTSVAQTFEDKCDAFITTLFTPPPVIEPTPVDQSPIHTTPLPPTSTACGPQKSTSSASKDQEQFKWEWPNLSDVEVREAIMSPSSKKAPGPDRLNFALLKAAYTMVPEVFNRVYSLLFIKGYHPKCWRKGLGIILRKPGKPDYSKPKAYRVITLLNCLGKVLEKIFATRLGHMANTSNLLHPSQLGGRKQRSAVDAALLLLHHIQMAKHRQKRCIVSTVFLDIKGAFDHVSKVKLIACLTNLKLPLSFISWVECFLSDRSIQLMFDGQVQSSTDINIGVPQGSPISPMLFLIYIRDLVQDEAFQLSYIDDFQITVSSTSARKNCQILSHLIGRLFQKAEEHGAEFEGSKSELIHFSGSRTEITDCVIIDDVTIHPQTVVRWLGIWFDCQLNFKAHVRKKLNLGMATLNGLSRLGSAQKGLSFRALRQLYIACVTSVTDFGAQLWLNKATGKMLEQHQRVQNIAIRQMLGAFRSTPTRAMELEAALPPPIVRLEKLCTFYALRTLRFQRSHPITQVLASHTEDELGDDGGHANLAYIGKPPTQLLALLSRTTKLVDDYNLELFNAEWEPPWADFPAEFYISKLSKPGAAKEHIDLVEELHPNADNGLFYTDGSQGLHGGVLTNSAAACRLGTNPASFSKTRMWNLGGKFEIADAEVFGVAKALVMAIENPPKHLYIFVDSQAAISRLRNSRGNSVIQKAMQTVAKLNTLGCKVHIYWCPAHMGIPGNEMADFLAKKGLGVPKSRETYTSLSHLARGARLGVSSHWAAFWSQLEVLSSARNSRGLGQMYRRVCQDSLDFRLRPSDHLFAFPKRVISAYTQLKTDKGGFKAHLKSIRKSDDDLCSCGAIQTSAHLVISCPLYKLERDKMRRKLKDMPLTMHILFTTKIGKFAVCNFILKTGICTAKWRYHDAEDE